MKFLLFFLPSILLFACQTKIQEAPARTSSADVAGIEKSVTSLYAGLTKAYNGAKISTDSLMDAYYEPNIYYVTPWGWTEPLDSTKARLKNAQARIRDYDHRIENLRVKSYGDGAYAFFVLRQNYTIDGRLLEEYLPTTLILERHNEQWKIVHAQRSTDYETMQQYVALQKGQK